MLNLTTLCSSIVSLRIWLLVCHILIAIRLDSGHGSQISDTDGEGRMHFVGDVAPLIKLSSDIPGRLQEIGIYIQ